MSENSRRLLILKREYTLLLFSIFFVALAASNAIAEVRTSFLSVPSSSFTPKFSEANAGYDGNYSGTERYFTSNTFFFAPVNLPHGATVTRFWCSARVDPDDDDFTVTYILRLNPEYVTCIFGDSCPPNSEFQDMATVGVGATSPLRTETDDSISWPFINNSNANYYIVAEVKTFHARFCVSCSIRNCKIRYMIDQ